MLGEQNVHAGHEHGCGVKCISWSAIFVGAVVGIGISFLINMFGLAIGLSAFKTTQAGMTAFALGGFLGMLIGVIVSMFTAGWVASYLGHSFCVSRKLGVLYGFTTWCVALLLAVLLTAHMTRFVSANSQAMMNPHNVMFVKMTNDNMPMMDISNTPAGTAQDTRTIHATINKNDRTTHATAVTSGTKGAQTTRMTITPEKAVNAAGLSLLLLFSLFFVGALASCLGGYYGANPRKGMGETKSNPTYK